MNLTFLKPILLPIVKMVVGKLITKEHVRHIIDLVFVNAHAVADKLPTYGAALSVVEASIDKDKLAGQIDEFLDNVL